MKTVTIPKQQYDVAVYVAAATGQVEDWKDARQLAKVLDKLEDQATELPEGGFELNADEAIFKFEDSEAAFLLVRLQKFMTNLQGWAAVKLLPIVDQLEAEEEPNKT